MTETVTHHETKRADELNVGDHIMEPGSGLSAVSATVPFPGGVVVVLTADRLSEPLALNWPADRPVRLATDDEIRAGSDAARRARFVANIRAFADWFEARPQLPIPRKLRAQVDLLGEAGVQQVNELAEELGLKVEAESDRTSADFQIGSWWEQVEYDLIAWHRDGVPGEEYAPEGRPTAVAEAKPDTLGVPLGHHGQAAADETSCLHVLPNGMRCDEPIRQSFNGWVHSDLTRDFGHDAVHDGAGA